MQSRCLCDRRPLHPTGRARCVRMHSLIQDVRQGLHRKGKSPSESARAAGPATNLRLFLDTASIRQMELWLSTGIFHGFTCNPTIIKRDGVKCSVKSLSAIARQGFDLGCKEIHLQAWGSSVAQMSSTAFDLAGIDPSHIVVKLPCTLEGIETAALLRDSNVRVNITGLYASPQVLVAQAVGAEYAAPYLGRMNDAYGGDQGSDQVLEMQRVLDGCGARMRLMVASVRDTTDMTKLAAKGCNTFTISPTIAAKLFNNAFTIDAAGEFENAAQSNMDHEDTSNTESQVTPANGNGSGTVQSLAASKLVQAIKPRGTGLAGRRRS